jgi:general secretion pathway protein E
MSLIKTVEVELTPRERQLEQVLLNRSLVSSQAINAAKMESRVTNESIGTILVNNGFLRQRDLTQALLSINPESLVDEELILPHVPLSLLIAHKIMLAAETVESVYVACLCPTAQARKLLAPYFPKQVIVFIPASIDRVRGYIEKLRIIHDSDSSVLEMLLRDAILHQASDIHINPKRNSYSVLMRFLGVRTLVHESDLDEYLVLAAKIKDRSKMDLAERRIPQGGGFSIEYNGRMIDLRVESVPGLFGETIVIRILDQERVQFNLDSLGISAIDQWKKGISRSDGLCLICGPTGSGKTTTLNATTRQLDRFSQAIYTVEDPVEYNTPFTTQVNINETVGLNFPRALRSFMRADPDIIIVGEVRDEDTARIAIKAAETGHLVFATLHTGSIPASIQRLKDLGVDPHELKYVLRAIMVQRLVRTLCPVCGGVEPNSLECPHCSGRRYTSRSIVSECSYFPGMKDVADLLSNNDIKWKTMIEDAYGKYMCGLTDHNEFLRVFGAEAEDMIDLHGARP